MYLETTTTVLGKTIFIRRRASSKINRVALSDKCSYRSRGSIHLTTIIRNTSTIDIETSNDLRNRIIKTQNNLNMARGILRSDGDGILGSDGCGLMKNAVLDVSLNLLDLLKSLLLIEAVDEQINIACWRQVFVIIFSQAPLTSSPLLRNR